MSSSTQEYLCPLPLPEPVEYKLWPGVAPGEAEARPHGERQEPDGIRRIHDVTAATLTLHRPARLRTDALVVVVPGGGYHILAHEHEGTDIAEWLARRGVPAAVLRYRVPARKGLPPWGAALQDAERCFRFCRAKAREWGLDPEKIGACGGSAGAHLLLLVATGSTTLHSYEPVDEIDKTPCHLNFAAPLYPAYVLKNEKDPFCTEITDLFPFDAKTPPMCFTHGDADGIPASGSMALCLKLRSMGIPSEIHTYAKVGHGFGMRRPCLHAADWMDRVLEWMVAMGFTR